MEQLQAELLKQVANLPPDANPYDFIDDVLLGAISPRRPKSFEVQLVVCMIAHALCGILILGSIVVRILKRSFWLVRIKTKNPNLWRPHFTAGWSLWGVVLVGFLELAVVNALSSSRRLEPKFAYWWTLAWIPAWMGGFSAAWAITVSLLLHLHSSGRDTHLVEKFSPLVNLASILLPVVYLAVIIPIALRCATFYESAIYDIEAIRRFLHAKASSFDGQFTLGDLAPIFPTIKPLEESYVGFLKWLRITFALYAGSACLLVLLLGTVAIFYVKVLRRALDELGDTASLRRENGQAQRDVVKKTYNNLILTLVSFTTIGFIFTGLSLYIAIEPESLSSHAAAEAVCLVAFYSFALFGLPTSLLLFIRSFDRTASDPPSSGSSNPFLARGRSHAQLPKISLPFSRRKSSNDTTQNHSSSNDGRNDEVNDDQDELNNKSSIAKFPPPAPPRGFEIVLPGGSDDHDEDESDLSYPPRRPPVFRPYYYYDSSLKRYSRSSTIEARQDSNSTRTSSSLIMSSGGGGGPGTVVHSNSTPRTSMTMTMMTTTPLSPTPWSSAGGTSPSETSWVARAGSSVESREGVDPLPTIS